MIIPLFVVDAFTDKPFHGNPAAVCPLENWLPDQVMQNIAAENNLAETAFLVQEEDDWRLRWFTPTVEIELCGHATLASAFVLALLDEDTRNFTFQTLSGRLEVTKKGNLYTLDFPERKLSPLEIDAAALMAVDQSVISATQAGSCWIFELESEAAVKAAKPDFGVIGALPCHALNITAKGSDCDFVSRFFAPKAGIPEDPVTGSAHCGLVPWWAGKLGKTRLHARQVSKRGGELFCEYRAPRVLMSGHGVLYSEGCINL
jgi:PhzF family phenazine biosynthesis protein